MAKHAKKTGSAADGSPSFEEELARLEKVVHQLEQGQLGLGESLQCYEQGVKHLKSCYQLLKQAEQKIELLLDVDTQGNERTEPFSEEEMALEEKVGRRSRRRSGGAAGSGKAGGHGGDVDVPGELF